MMARVRLPVRVTGFLAGAVLAACAALTAPAASAGPAASAILAASTAPAAAAASSPAGVGAKSAAVENAANGRLLWSRGLNTERPMASITKVMTAFIVIRAGHLNRTITVPSAVVGYVQEHDASNAGLVPGDKLTTRQLLYGLLLPSGADAAYALAEAYGPGLNSVVGQRSYRLTARSGHHAYLWRNLNPLLGHYPGAIGVKSGYTRAAGQCLLFEATRNGYSVIGVTLDSPGSITAVDRADATRILNWAFSLRR
jgi:D-alanyl-D-alanine carboxypeptidase (penicillin-binding protein 5/6)